MESGFQRKAYVEIVEDMQARAREVFGDNINLSDSSPIGMFIQSIAWEISVAWDMIEQSYQSGFAYYATGNSLDKVASNAMKKRFKGSRAIVRLSFQGGYGVVVPKGFAVSTDDGLVFRTLEETEIIGTENTVQAQADDVGEEYNVSPGAIVEIVNPTPNIEAVTNPAEAIGGTDVETDDAFRERHLEAMVPITGDNPAQYKVWAREIPNVGGAHVLPTEPKPGYTTVLIANDDGLPASEELVAEVKEHILKQRPATAGVVVASVKPKAINISASVRVEGNLEEVRAILKRNIEEYFAEEALSAAYVSYARLGRMILSSEGITDYNDLTMNGSNTNIPLSQDEVPVLEEVELIEWR